MVLMKQEHRDQLRQLRAQCGQERDVQVKQVENGFIIQSATRFFADPDGKGVVQVAEISDTTIAVSATEAGLIAKNFIQHGEFWPDGIRGVDMDEEWPVENAAMEAVEAPTDPHQYNAILDGEESGPAVYVHEYDHVMPEIMRKKEEQARVQEARETAEYLNKQYKAPSLQSATFIAAGPDLEVKPIPMPVRGDYAGPAD